jgi:hypothetical protein
MFGFLQNLNRYAVIPFVYGLESIHRIFLLHNKFARRASGIVEKKYRKTLIPRRGSTYLVLCLVLKKVDSFFNNPDLG